jgi:hypothetical protein
MSRCDTFTQAHMAGAARFGARAPEVLDSFAFGIAPSIHGPHAWMKTWDLQPGYSVKHNDRTIPRPLERSP